MARITVQALHVAGEPRRWTLSERIVAENLDSDHYVAQLLERVSWATADAEAVESPPAGHGTADHDDARHAGLRIGARGHDPSRRSGSRPITGGRRA